MNIEFDFPSGEMKPWVIDHVRDSLIEMHHAESRMTRAHVVFRSEKENAHLKICEITLPGFGSELYIHASGDSYEQASREMLTSLRHRIDERIKGNQEPPDVITSTIRV